MDDLTPTTGIPLCIDLDGTLTPIDTLHESLILLAKQSPLELLRLPRMLLSGKAAFKHYVTERLLLNDPKGSNSSDTAPLTNSLPLRDDLLSWIHGERSNGRHLVLVTAAEGRIATAAAEQAGCFDEVLATDGTTNLSAGHKRDLLVARFGDKGFDYAGNSRDDLAVWLSAREAIVVDASRSVLRRAQNTANVTRIFDGQKVGIHLWLRAIRIHQWVKNALIFLPLLLAHQLSNAQALIHLLIAFVAFGFCASSVYLLNDLLDLASDRRHPRKRHRPFASGALPASQGVAAAALLLILAGTLATLAGPAFAAVLALYYLTTVAYGFKLKKIALVDVMLLAGLYTLRIIAGAAAAGIELSFWLLAFSTFIFLSLGIVKRYTELDALTNSTQSALHGRGYARQDLIPLLALGAASGLIAVLVLALYVNSPESTVLYHHPRLLWLLCPLLLYWVSRVWLQTTRGVMHDDPIVFALKDRVSLIIGALAGTILSVAAWS